MKTEEPNGRLLDVMLAESLERTGILEVLSGSVVGDRVKLRLRVSSVSRWNHMMTLILKEEERSSWGVHICKQNILHEGRLVYTWNFIVQGDDAGAAVHDLCRVFDLICSNIGIFDDAEEREVRQPQRAGKAKAETPRRHVGHGDLDEISLVGAEGRSVPDVAWNQFRSSGRRKGAHPIGGD